MARDLDAEGKSYRPGERLLSFLETDDLRYIFFGQRTFSPTEHTASGWSSATAADGTAAKTASPTLRDGCTMELEPEIPVEDGGMSILRRNSV